MLPTHLSSPRCLAQLGTRGLEMRGHYPWLQRGPRPTCEEVVLLTHACQHTCQGGVSIGFQGAVIPELRLDF